MSEALTEIRVVAAVGSDIDADALQPVGDADTAMLEFKNAVDEWSVKLGLESWRICVSNVTEIDGDNEAYAGAYAEPKYKLLTLSVNAERMATHNFSPLQIESTAVHELVHAVLWNLAGLNANPQLPDEIRSHFEETTTEDVANSLLRTKYNNNPALLALWTRCGVPGAAGRR